MLRDFRGVFLYKKFRVGKFEYFFRVCQVTGNRGTFFSLKGSNSCSAY